MFENIIGQAAAEQLARDVSGGVLAPAMLFEGPLSSGKGSAALELARVVSCEQDAAWNCACPACARHRLLLHPDLLCLGARSFSAEIAASSGVFLKDRGGTSRILFIRSIRKLLARFNPALWEDEPKFSRLGSLAVSIEDSLDELDAALKGLSAKNSEAVEKISAAILKDSFKLESDGISDSVPIAFIRRAAYWSRLAPSGRRKLLLIENAEAMQEGARNSLLKLLEEPPATVTVVLTSAKPKTMLATVLSRLRPYRFAPRGEATEREVIRRVFRNGNFIARGSADSKDNSASGGTGLINSYLDSFLPVTGEALEDLAAFFAASAAYRAALLRKKQHAALSPELVLLGKFTAARAEKAGLEKTREGREAAAKVLEGTMNFEIRSLFYGFLRSLQNLVLEGIKTSTSSSSAVFLELWRNCIAEAASGAVYNQNNGLILERLFTGVSRGMADTVCGSS